MSAGHIVEVNFWAAFILDIFIMFYAFSLSKKIGNKGLLSRVIVLTGFTALVFGIHHVLEIFLENTPMGIAIAEGVEGVAAIILLIATYSLYKLVKGDDDAK